MNDEPAAEAADEPARLDDPFPWDDVEVRVLVKKRDDPKKALVSAYVRAESVTKRLDEVCEANGWYWCDSFREVISGDPKVTHIECTITIHMGDGKVVSRSDVGEGHDQSKAEADPVKTAYSDALKRAALKFGIGRLLRNLDVGYVDINEYGRLTVESWAKVEREYNSMLAGNAPWKRRDRAQASALIEAANRPKPVNGPGLRGRGDPPRQEPAPDPAPPPADAPPQRKPMSTEDWDRFWGGLAPAGWTRESVYAEVNDPGSGDVLRALDRRELLALYERLKKTTPPRVKETA